MQIKNEAELDPLPDSIPELDTIAKDLWEAYFTPAKPITSAERKVIRERYNKAAAKRNDLGKFKALIILTPSTRVETKATPAPKQKPTASPVKVVAVSNSVENGEGKIAQIINLHISGKTNKEIIEAGFNKSTVNRQVGEYKKRQQLNSK